MLNLIQEFEAKLVDQVINEGKSPEDESIKQQVAEWKALKKKMAVIEKISKAISSRVEELEVGFEEVIKEQKEKKAVIDGAIIQYTQKKSNTTVKYKEAVDYALKMVNEAQKKVLEEFIKSVTKQGTISDVLSVVDPELEKFLIDLKDASGDELMNKIETMARAGFDRLPKQIANAKKRDLKEGVIKNIEKVLKNIGARFRTIFAKYFKAEDKSKQAVDALLKAVKADPLKESVVNEGVSSVAVDPQSGEDRAKFLKACEDRGVVVISEKDKNGYVVVELPKEGSATAVLMSLARKLGAKFTVVDTE